VQYEELIPNPHADPGRLLRTELMHSFRSEGDDENEGRRVCEIEISVDGEAEKDRLCGLALR